MKRIIFFGLLVFSLAASAQDKPSYFIGLPGQTAHARGNLRVDSVFLNALKDTLFTPWRLGLQVFRPADSSLYISTSLVAASKWTKLGAASGSAVWGTITGTLSSQTDLQAALDGKQDAVTLGTTSQYFKGDFSLGTFSSDVTAITDPLYASLSHTHNGLAPVGGNTGQVLTKNSNTNYDYSWTTVGTGTVTNVATGLWLSGGPITSTGTIVADSASMAAYFLRRKDSALYITPTYLNSLGYLTTETDPDFDANGVKLTGNQTIAGFKTFSSGTYNTNNAGFTVIGTGSANRSQIGKDGTTEDGFLFLGDGVGGGGFGGFLVPGDPTGNWTWTMPNKSGTLATLDDITGGSGIDTNLGNDTITANGNYPHDWDSNYLKIQNLSELELTSYGTSNFGIKDLKGEKGIIAYGKNGADEADVFAAGSSTGQPIAGLDAFNATKSNFFHLYMDSARARKKINYSQNLASTYDSLSLITKNDLDSTADLKVDAAQLMVLDTAGAQDGDEAYIDRTGADTIKFRTPTGGGSGEMNRYDTIQTVSTVADLETATGNIALVYDSTVWVKPDSTVNSWRELAYTSNVATFGGGGGLQDFDFTGAGVTESSANVWEPTTPDAAYGHLGLGDVNLASSMDGYIMADVDAATDGDGQYILGFNTANSAVGYNSMPCGVRPVIGTGYGIWDGAGNFVGYNGTCADGDKFRIKRTGSTWTLERSTDGGSTWPTTIYTFTTFTTTATVYPVVDIYGNAKIKNPKGEGLIP